jgi:hypothetical protein
VLRKVELPYAMPQIMAGLTQCIMLSLSMVVIAALVGANGLGVPVVRALNTVNISMGFEAGLCIVILAIILDRLFRAADGGERRQMTAAVVFKNVSIIFGDSPQKALAMVDAGKTRDEIRRGDRPGARRADATSLSIDRGRDPGADGPFRLRQVDAAARRQRACARGARRCAGEGREWRGECRTPDPEGAARFPHAHRLDGVPAVRAACPGARSRTMSASASSLPACRIAERRTRRRAA